MDPKAAWGDDGGCVSSSPVSPPPPERSPKRCGGPLGAWARPTSSRRDSTAWHAPPLRGSSNRWSLPRGTGSPPAEADRAALLGSAARVGAVAIDAELGTAALAVELPEPCERIASHHEPADAAPPAPEQAARLVEALCETGASSLKLAAPAGDAAVALAWMRAATAAAGCRELTPIPLGAAGRGLRLLSGRGLASLLYCAEGEPAAPGQPRLDDVLDLHAAPLCDASTPLYAVVGWPLIETWSPVLHGALLRRSGRAGLLVPLPVREASAVLPLLEDLGVTGAAVTMPYKEVFGAASISLSERVGRTGSLNSLRRGPGGWEAESFDGPAALAALGGPASLAGRRVAVVGAGGAAAALLAELAAAGVDCTVLARRESAARVLAERLGVGSAPLGSLHSLAADVVVNATPADPCEPLAKGVAFDMRTTPPDTDWLRRAAGRRLDLVDGLAMFARQAAAQQRWWGTDVADAETEDLLRELVAERGGEAA